jgi:hypothetical protein
MPKVYHLRKGQLHMVKNAKMFKERFEAIRQELLGIKINQWGTKSSQLTEIEQHQRNESPGDLFIALEILKRLMPRVKFDEKTNKHTSYLQTIIVDTFPNHAEEIEQLHVKRAKELNKEQRIFEEKVEKTYKELLDKVLFNGKDPLEAINELQALKIK